MKESTPINEENKIIREQVGLVPYIPMVLQELELRNVQEAFEKEN